MPKGIRKPDPPGPSRYEAASQRYQAVRQLADAGKRQCEIARALDLNPSHVSWLLRNPIEPITVTEFPQVVGVTFRHVPDLAGYAVGDDGSVWSSHTRQFARKPGWYPVAIQTKDGYKHVGLRIDAGRGKTVRRFVHALVLGAFVGPKPEGMECRHRDNNPANNALGNICWGTPKQNAEDRMANGRLIKGMAHRCAKLTEDDVREVRRLRKLGWSQQRLADVFKVSTTAISYIDRGKTWKHVA